MAQVADSRRSVPLKFLAFSTGIPMPCPSARRPWDLSRAACWRAGRPACRVRSLADPRLHLRCRAHAASSSSESCEATISRYTSLRLNSSLCVPMPTIRPSSSTMIGRHPEQC